MKSVGHFTEGSNGTAILEKPVRQYVGQLDAQLLVKWVATVKLLSGIPILKGAFMMTVTTQHEESTAASGDRLLMAIELGRRQWHVGFTTQRGQRIRRYP